MSTGITAEVGQTFAGIGLAEVFYKVAHLDNHGRPSVINALNCNDQPYKGDSEPVIAEAVSVFDAEFGTTDDRFLSSGSIWLSYGRNSKPKVVASTMVDCEPAGREYVG